MTLDVTTRSAVSGPGSGPTRPRKRKQQRLFYRMARCWQIYVLLAAPMIFALIFYYWPLYGVQIAFKNFSIVKGITGSPWVGLQYIDQFVHSYLFWPVLRNTIILHLYGLVATFPLPIVLALLLNALNSDKFRKVVQTITYAPYFISVVVLVGMMLMMLSPSSGVVNVILQSLTGHTIDFLSAGMFRHTFVWSGAWQTMGYSAIIYLAALAGVDPQLHESARVDGAGILKRMWHIDLPSILPVVVTLLILNMGSLLTSGFEKVLLMQNSNNIGVSQVVETYTYQVAFNSQIPQYSYGAAIGIFMSAISFVLLIGANSLARRLSGNSLF